MTGDPGKTHNIRFAYDPNAAVPAFDAPMLASVSFGDTFIVSEAGTTVDLNLSGPMDDNGRADLRDAKIMLTSISGKVVMVNSGLRCFRFIGRERPSLRQP